MLCLSICLTYEVPSNLSSFYLSSFRESQIKFKANFLYLKLDVVLVLACLMHLVPENLKLLFKSNSSSVRKLFT
jgi:hypothetical protein